MKKGDYLKNLIEELAEKVGTDTSWKGYQEMVSALTEATGEKFDTGTLKGYYNYDEAKDPTPRATKLDTIAEYLGYKNYRAFCDEKDDPVLQSLVGNYYSYIRMNHEEANLLRSPVKITMDDGKIYYHQKGGRLEFNGKLKRREGCLFVLMESNEGKSFYHVYQIGTRTKPDVLQGIFSGMSTGSVPIGGRAVLLRTNEIFDKLETGILDIKKMLSSSLEEEQTLAQYFEHREENNLSIKRPSNFNLFDLRGG